MQGQLGVQTLLNLAYALKDSGSGAPIDLRKILAGGVMIDAWRECALLACQADLIIHQRQLLGFLWKLACRDPADRLCRVLLDAYQRQASVAETPAFYRSLLWLFPQDEWAAAAARDWHTRALAALGPNDVPADPIELADVQKPPAGFLSALRNQPAVDQPRYDGNPAHRERAEQTVEDSASPWVAADAIHGMLLHHQQAEAQDAARRYQSLCVEAGSIELRGWANRLVQLADAAPADAE